MKCAEIKNYLDDYALGELNFSNSRKVESHLKECRSCEKETEALKITNYSLKSIPPLAPSAEFDAQMMQAFQKHQETKEQPRFWTTVFANFSISKSALAFGLLALIVFTGASFQLGRITSPTAQTSQTVSRSTQASDSNQIVKIVEKRVEIPVYKEKIVNRIVYRKAENPKTIYQSRVAPPELQNAQIHLKRSEESLEPLTLKDFQPVSELKIQTVARSENNEK